MLWEAERWLSRSRCITVREGNVPTESFYMYLSHEAIVKWKKYLLHKLVRNAFVYELDEFKMFIEEESKRNSKTFQ